MQLIEENAFYYCQLRLRFMWEADQLNAPLQPLSTPPSRYHSINFLLLHLSTPQRMNAYYLQVHRHEDLE